MLFIRGKMSYNQYLERIYFDPSHPASFAGPDKLYSVVKKEGTHKISKSKIRQWLQDQDEYSKHRDVKRKFVRRQTVVSGVDSQWGIDLASVQNISKYNDGVEYLLIVIDVFSKYLIVEPVRSKKSNAIVEAFDRVLAHGRYPGVVYSDKGGEFNNALFKRYLKRRNISYFTTQNEDIKVSVAERVIRTLKNKMYKYFERSRSYRFVEELQNLVYSYNHTPHRSLGSKLSPVQVNKTNEEQIWDHMYGTKDREHITSANQPRRLKLEYQIGDLVRLSYNRYTFQRDYHQKWTTEIFKVSERFLTQNIPLYRVKDYLGEKIAGTFYQRELQKVNKTEDALWIVEKVLKKRKRAGKVEYYVKFDGWGNKYNSWIAEDSIQNIKK